MRMQKYASIRSSAGCSQSAPSANQLAAIIFPQRQIVRRINHRVIEINLQLGHRCACTNLISSLDSIKQIDNRLHDPPHRRTGALS